MENKSYYITKDKKKKETVYFELDKLDGYCVKPKVRKEDEIKVNKIIFVNSEMSEKLIRKKIDRKIAYLLEQLKLIGDDDSGDDSVIKRSLIEAEKLRIQLINKYIKYLGHTYYGLTLKKLQVIIDQLRYELYVTNIVKPQVFYKEEKESKRGR